MSDQSPFANLHPEENYPYTPSPLGARIVHSLININYMLDPLPQGLPNEWLIAIDAVRKVREKDQYTRWRAFIESTKEFPYSMIDEVNAYDSVQTVDRAEKDRILYRLKDVIQPPPPREWVVDGILSRSSLNLLVGNPGSKKTYMAVDLAFCVAMGKPWLGCPIGTSGIPSPVVGAMHASPSNKKGGLQAAPTVDNCSPLQLCGRGVVGVRGFPYTTSNVPRFFAWYSNQRNMLKPMAM